MVVALAWATVARPDGTADEAPIPESRLEVLLDGGSAAPGATRRWRAGNATASRAATPTSD